MKPFGYKSSNYDLGYTLPLLTGHIEALKDAEEWCLVGYQGPKWKRLELVDSALDLLNQAIDMGNET